MAFTGQTEVQGLHGISSVQRIIGWKFSSSTTGVGGKIRPGLLFKISAFWIKDESIAIFLPSWFARRRAAIRPLNIADEASAISSASPALTTGKPNWLAISKNSSSGVKPTAISKVSTAKVRAVSNKGWKWSSTAAMITLSTLPLPSAAITVCFK